MSICSAVLESRANFAARVRSGSIVVHDHRARFPIHRFEPTVQPGDVGSFPAAAHERCGRFDLRLHIAAAQFSSRDHHVRLRRGQVAHKLLLGPPERPVDAVDVGQDGEHRRADLVSEDLRGAIFVDHAIHAVEPEGRIPPDGRAAAARDDHDRSIIDEPLHLLPLDDPDRARRGGEASPAAICRPHGPAVPLGEVAGNALFHDSADRLDRLVSRRVVGVDEHLGDHRHDVPSHASARQRVLERLLDHVADPPGRGGHEHSERQRRQPVSRAFVSHQLVADLRAVAVDHRDLPALFGQLDDGCEALARPRELIVNVTALAGLEERVAS